MSDQNDQSTHDDFHQPVPRANEKGSPFFETISNLDFHGFDEITESPINDVSDESEKIDAPHLCSSWLIFFGDAEMDKYPDRVNKANEFYAKCSESMRKVERAYANLEPARRHYELIQLMIGSGCDNGEGRLQLSEAYSLENEPATVEYQSEHCPTTPEVIFRLLYSSDVHREWAEMHLPLCHKCHKTFGYIQQVIGRGYT